ncbi:YopT-type cysteine protease domain-containing protein [Hahella sp. CR1]|uniref:YopT-type cysteine protease domain-containing protein n=1 Tax=Hahella sp. CR1 TaxID=2992807 RepID=UPI002442443A|nr:YopT-type cysteine protease domain-containing protein [Hahella sp. CR1]MDG9666261.1 YopT-type cysteine protease domain-containing protein [Hahella sp. CR1]
MIIRRIAEFDQTVAMSGLTGRSQAASEGACHNFTINWLSLMFQDNGDITRAKQRMAKLGVRSGAGNPVLQKAFGDRWGEGGNSYKMADKLMIQIRGLKEVALLKDYSHFSQRWLESTLMTPQYAGYIYSFWFPMKVVGADGAHTIGFFRSVSGRQGQLVPNDATIVVFDPNYGEFHVPEAEFHKWFRKFRTYYGGTVTSHMVKCVAPI